MNKIAKKIDQAFGKKVYLVGQLKDGSNIWLEEATWDCDWYWGFGYLETYAGNCKPSSARDISSHQHVDGFLFKKDGSDYIDHFYQSKDFQYLTFTEEESWELADLFQSFYTLKEAAEFFHRGGSHVSTSAIKGELKNTNFEKSINADFLPKIFKRIYELLEPIN